MSIDQTERGLVASESETHPVSEPDGDRYYAVPVTVNRRIGEMGFGAMCGILSLVSAFAPTDGYPPWFWVPFFSLLSLHFLARGISEGPRLTMDADGILDRTSIVGGPLRILWADVLRVTASRWLPGTVRLEVRDLTPLLARAGLRRRLELWIGKLLGSRTISINTPLLGISSKKLRERLDAELLRFERAQLGFSEDQGELLPEGWGPDDTGPGRS
jgi:hypothetical protein